MNRACGTITTDVIFMLQETQKERRKKKSGAENVFEEIMAQIFQNMRKDNLQIQ